MRKSAYWILLALLVGLGAGYLTGAKHPPRQHLQIAVVPGLNKTFPIVNRGDKISWLGPDGKKMTVDFGVLKPCSEVSSAPNSYQTDTCTIDRDQGVFPYTCKPCDDPVVPIKSAIGTKGDMARVTTAVDTYIGLYCGNPISSAQPVVAQESARPFQWVEADDASNGWEVTFTDASPCTEGKVFSNTSNPLKNVCTPTTPAPLGDYPYTISIPSCKNASGASTLGNASVRF